MQMQDPSYGVAQPLQNHVHLISGHKFAIQPSLNLNTAFRCLLDAPTIVKQTAAMAWQYVQSPSDGTVWLEWISQRNGETHFASDGYVWGDPEQTFQQDFGGYRIEWMTHTIGFRPQAEHVATHARTRFHLVGKNPNFNAAPPDPSLWIVHYYTTDQNRMMPASQVPISQQMRQIMAERRWLETQGRIQHKEFMLHDREHWPTVNLPGNAQSMQQPGMYANPMMQQQMAAQQRFPQYPAYPPGQGPPAKRARHSGPQAMPGATEGVHDIIEEEENVSAGDMFDHLTPRDISIARFKQHHRWMEEVFSSPYATSRIVPADLGLGLMGELKGLTEGLLEAPSVQDLLAEEPNKPAKAKEAQPFTNLKKEQVDEFNRRVEKHLEDGQAEIERMKSEHAEKMAEWKKTKTLMQAERRLRYATWEGHESAVPVYRLEVPNTNGHHADETARAESVEDVIRDVEDLLGVKIESHQDATMVQKGGLEKEEKPEAESIMNDGVDSETEMAGMQPQEQMMSGANGSGLAARPDFSEQVGTEPKAEAMQPNIPADVPQPTFQAEEQQRVQDEATDAPPPFVLERIPEPEDPDDLEGMDMGDTSLMDLDVDGTGDIDFMNDEETELVDEEAGDITEQPVQPVVGELQEDSGANLDVAQAAGDEAELPKEATQQQLSEPATTSEAVPWPSTGADQPIAQSADLTTATRPEPIIPGLGDDRDEDQGAPADDPAEDDNEDLFGDTTFDDLTNLPGDVGDDADDGLIDFDGGLGMEESAFGDAMHGMDTNTPRSGVGGLGDDGGDAGTGTGS